jgi:hypothetical protein
VKSRTVLTLLLLMPLACGENRGTSPQPKDAAQVEASGGQAGASNAAATGGQAGVSSAQGGNTTAQGGTSSVQAGGGRTGSGGAGGGGLGTGAAGTETGGRSGTGGIGQDGSAGKTTGGAGGGASTGNGGAGGAASGFVAFWNFESIADSKIPEAGGRALPLTVDKAQLVEGQSGKQLAFTSAQASATAQVPIVDASTGFSVSVWVTLDKLDTWDTFVSQDGQTISSFYLQKRDSDYFAFTTFPEDSTSAKACIAESTLKPRAGEWYHLVATRSAASGDQRLYVDGVLMGKVTCAGGFKTSGPLVLGRGRWDGPVDWMAGAIDELGIADRVLTPEEIVDLYHQGRPDARHYLFTYFTEQALARGDGLRLAHSHDALYWGAIGAGKVFMAPTVGGKSFRDPHVMRDPSGTYHLVWTTSCVPWGESNCVQDRGFGHATSKDMATFSDAKYITVALNAEHVWAPETIWDPSSQQFMLYWSTPIDSNPSASDPHSIYYMLTKDFIAFSAPEVLYGKTGRNFIDATIIKQGEAYLMFLKDEADGQKNIRVLSSTALFGSSAWTDEPSAAITGAYGAEGPSPLLIDGQMLLFFDKFADGAYGALRSRMLDALTAPASWPDISSSVFFAGVRHGTAIEVPFDVFRTVALKAAQ